MRWSYTDLNMSLRAMPLVLLGMTLTLPAVLFADQEKGEFPPAGYGLKLEKAKKADEKPVAKAPPQPSQPAQPVKPAQPRSPARAAAVAPVPSTRVMPQQRGYLPVQPGMGYPAQAMPPMRTATPNMMPWPYAQRPALQQPYGVPMMMPGAAATPWINNRMLPMQRPMMNYPAMPQRQIPGAMYPMQQMRMQQPNPMNNYRGYPAAPNMQAYPAAPAAGFQNMASRSAAQTGQRPVYPMRKKIVKKSMPGAMNVISGMTSTRISRAICGIL